MQPGLKNLTDHFLEEWFWRPAAIASYSGGRLSGARSSGAWHDILSEMGMVVISSALAVGPIAQTLDSDGAPSGGGGKALELAFPKFADDLAWWAEAAKAQRARRLPPIEFEGQNRPAVPLEQFPRTASHFLPVERSAAILGPKWLSGAAPPIHIPFFFEAAIFGRFSRPWRQPTTHGLAGARRTFHRHAGTAFLFALGYRGTDIGIDRHGNRQRGLRDFAELCAGTVGKRARCFGEHVWRRIQTAVGRNSERHRLGDEMRLAMRSRLSPERANDLQNSRFWNYKTTAAWKIPRGCLGLPSNCQTVNLRLRRSSYRYEIDMEKEGRR